MYRGHILPQLRGFDTLSVQYAAQFLTHFITRLNNTAQPPGRVENHSQLWLKQQGIFHMTAPKGEPNYNSVIERAYNVLENTGFIMIFYGKKPRAWWHWAFDWATCILDRCPRRSNASHFSRHFLRRNRT